MAAKMPNLRRARGRYFWRARVPIDLVQRVGKTVLHCPLGADLARARRTARNLTGRAEGLFSLLRGNMTLTRDEIDELVRELYRRRLHEDTEEFYRTGTNEDVADLYRDFAAELDQELRTGSFTESERAASELIEGRTLALDRSSPVFRELVTKVARALREAAYITAERAEANWSAKPMDPLFVEPAAPVPVANGTATDATKTGPTVSEVFKKWSDEKAAGWGKRTRQEWQEAVNRFIDIVGDVPAKTVTRDHSREFKEGMLSLPSSMSKRFRGMTTLEAVAAAKEDPSIPRQAPATINKKLAALNSLFAWCEVNGLVERNPFERLKVDLNKRADEQRRPFSTDDLRAIFASPIYQGCKSRGRRLERGSEIYRDDAQYWLFPLGLYTGCRLEELAGLALDDVATIDSVSCLNIRPNDFRQLKTASSRRIVPIHSTLFAMGFGDYVEVRRKRGDERVFPDVKSAGVRPLSASFSQWFGRIRRRLEIIDNDKGFHSTRHNFKDALRAALVAKDIQDQLLGHAASDVGSRYGSGYPIALVKDAVEKVKYAVEPPSR